MRTNTIYIPHATAAPDPLELPPQKWFVLYGFLQVPCSLKAISQDSDCLTSRCIYHFNFLSLRYSNDMMTQEWQQHAQIRIFLSYSLDKAPKAFSFDSQMILMEQLQMAQKIGVATLTYKW